MKTAFASGFVRAGTSFTIFCPSSHTFTRPVAAVADQSTCIAIWCQALMLTGPVKCVIPGLFVRKDSCVPPPPGSIQNAIACWYVWADSQYAMSFLVCAFAGSRKYQEKN